MGTHLPISARRALRKLGADLAFARRRRRISTASMAERSLISRTTLNKIEKGDGSVSMAAYLSVMLILGFEKRLASLAAAETDEVGLALDAERIPRRIRS
ncbi:MAG: helix-turn-helix transcriptional regulator [Boseongicola sp. SB0677_bin_26]|nr:helix-turn-helix transcriptional regulator [Boseongicola sp. SB0665_bin_10]MYG25038.1 helix-turn-helix transcriptional regulator [Boseongicola sp. SB0677_bin_26]